MNPTHSNVWWQTLYDETVADLFLVRTDLDELTATIAFLWRQFGATPGRTVFDQCCGIGSLSIPLAQRGARVLGVDQCEAYIQRASRDAAPLGTACTFERGDASDYVPDSPCHGAFNWGSGFGNADDQRNIAMLHCAFAALEPDGRFILDYQHIPRVLREFQRCLVHRQATPKGEMLLVRESEIDLTRGSFNQQWTFIAPDGQRLVRQSALRTYMPNDLGDFLRMCGFVDVAFHGGVRGEKLSLHSPRCIVVGRRPS